MSDIVFVRSHTFLVLSLLISDCRSLSWGPSQLIVLTSGCFFCPVRHTLYILGHCQTLVSAFCIMIRPFFIHIIKSCQDTSAVCRLQSTFYYFCFITLHVIVALFYITINMYYLMGTGSCCINVQLVEISNDDSKAISTTLFSLYYLH